MSTIPYGADVPHIHSNHNNLKDYCDLQDLTTIELSEIASKQTTAERIHQETDSRLSQTAGRVRELGASGRADRSWNSSKPNQDHTWDCLDDSFQNREAHEDAVSVLDAWKFAPWKGMIWGTEVSDTAGTSWMMPESSILKRGTLVWVEKTTYSGQWELLADQPPPMLTEPPAALYKPYTGPMLQEKATKVDINRAYEQYLLDPEDERPNLWVAIASFAPRGGRFSQAKSLLNGTGADFYLEASDVINDFALEVMRRFSNGQYKQTHPFHTWIKFVWKTYFFPKVQTTVHRHMKLNTFMTQTETDDPEYAAEQHTVQMSCVEQEMFEREQEGYKFPTALRDRVLRELDDPSSRLCKFSPRAQGMLRAIATGSTKDEAAECAGISDRQARRIWTGMVDAMNATDVHEVAK